MSGGSRPTPTKSPTPSADELVLTLWTADPVLARRADEAGVDRVGIDLDRLGKAQRQRGRGTWISPHEESDLEGLVPALRSAQLFARVNPLHADTGREVDAVLDRGAKVLMLPMVESRSEAEEFTGMVDGRATVVLLAETRDALRNLGELAAAAGVHEVHIGLNDLALSLGLRNRWQVLAGDLALEAGRAVRDAGRRFGLGGIGRPGDTDLPVPADLVYAEIARTGATATLLSRSFWRDGAEALEAEIALARKTLAAWRRRPRRDLDAAHAELAHCANAATVW